MELWLIILISISASIVAIAPLIIFLLVYYKHKIKRLNGVINFYKNMKPLEIKHSKKNIRTLVIQKMYPKNEPLPLFETDLDKEVKNEMWCEFCEELRKYMRVDIKETSQGIMRYRAEFDVVEDDRSE